MIKEDLNLDYKDFIKQYVTSPICEYTFSFSYKGNFYQFDYVGVPKNDDGSIAYDFISYADGWNIVLSRVRFGSLKDALSKAKIEGKCFEEIYNSEDSELIDIS